MEFEKQDSDENFDNDSSGSEDENKVINLQIEFYRNSIIQVHSKKIKAICVNNRK